MNPQQIAEIIKREISKQMRDVSQKSYYRGIVKAVDNVRCTVELEGAGGDLPNLLCMNGYEAKVGDRVLVLSIGLTGANFLVLGRIETTHTGKQYVRNIGNISGGVYSDQLDEDDRFIAFSHSSGGSPSDSPTGTQASVLAMPNNWGKPYLAIPNSDDALYWRNGNSDEWRKISDQRGSIVAEVFSPSNFSISSKDWTDVPYNSVIWDTHSMWNNSTKRFTVPEDGLYWIEARLRLEDTNGQFRYVLRAFGSMEHHTSASRYLADIVGGGNNGDTPSNHGIGGGTLLAMDAGDNIGIQLWHNIGSNRSYPYSGGSRNQNHFTIRKVSDWTP